MSNDGENWVEVASGENMACDIPNESVKDFSLSYDGLYTWLKFEFTDPVGENSWFSQSDWRFEATMTGI